MDKEQQIKDIKKCIGKGFSDLICGAEDFEVIYECIQDGAEALYNAGYRKTFTSNLASDTQKAFKEGYEKAHKETAKEILQTLYNKCYDINDETGESMGCFISDDDIIDLAKEYGAEVEE